MMPLNLFLLRHGQSIGNWANDLVREGRYEEIPERLHGVPIWLLKLTALGITQAQRASCWLDDNFGLENITAAIHSPFVRAIQTASHIGIPGRIWRESSMIRERSWGDMDHIPTPEEYVKYQLAKINKSRDLSWQPPNGELLMSLTDRLTHLYGTMHRQHSDDSVLWVMHGESIVATKIDLERLHLVTANKLIADKNPILYIPNCGITQYTRINPWDISEIRRHLTWVREIDPMDPPKDPQQIWRKIEREKLNNGELAGLVSAYGID